MFATLSPWLWAFLLTIVIPLVEKVLLALGVGFVTYQAVDYVMDELKNQFIGYLNGLPADVIDMVAIMKVDMAFSMILGAVIVKYTIMGLNGASGRKKLVFRA